MNSDPKWQYTFFTCALHFYRDYSQLLKIKPNLMKSWFRVHSQFKTCSSVIERMCPLYLSNIISWPTWPESKISQRGLTLKILYPGTRKWWYRKPTLLYLLSVQQKIYDGTSAITVHKEDPLNKHFLTIMLINQVLYSMNDIIFF